MADREIVTTCCCVSLLFLHRFFCQNFCVMLNPHLGPTGGVEAYYPTGPVPLSPTGLGSGCCGTLHLRLSSCLVQCHPDELPLDSPATRKRKKIALLDVPVLIFLWTNWAYSEHGLGFCIQRPVCSVMARTFQNL